MKLVFGAVLIFLRFDNILTNATTSINTNAEEEEENDRLMTRTLPPITEDPFTKNLGEIDQQWLIEALRDVAYYLRGHKFNEWDRRYYKNESSAPHNFHTSFLRPPLRSLHWEVRKFCEPSFIDCLKYLARKARNADLKRQDDSVYIILEQKWFESDYSAQVLSVDSECRKIKKKGDITGKPFQGPIERLQWRATASYYMCWYTMNEVPVLRYFNETCDNFANCINPWKGLYNNDPRAADDEPFACAIYSFCPDTCCTSWVTNDTKSCWEHGKDNPCFEGNPTGQRDCSLERLRNTDFNDIVLNRWNVTCKCPQVGVEWNSRFGMCIDIDECLLGLHNCTAQTQECINLIGSFRCVCRWGYIWDDVSQSCIESGVLGLITYTKQEEDRKGPTSETETSLVRKIFKLFQRRTKRPKG